MRIVMIYKIIQRKKYNKKKIMIRNKVRFIIKLYYNLRQGGILITRNGTEWKI